MVARYSILTDRALLEVTGKDAQAFLQGLVSGDVRKVSADHAIYAALLTPQGKFLYDFFILPAADGYFIEVATAQCDALMRKLGFYKLRSDVSITTREDLLVAALWDDHAPTLCCGDVVKTPGKFPLVFTDPRLAALGMRLIGPKESLDDYLAQCEQVSEAAYLYHRLSLGVPDGVADLVPEKSLLLEWGIDHLGGVDFAKGCYIGQEVTARTRHRAQLRKFVHLVRAHTSLPEPGTPIIRDGQEIGVLASSSGNLGLALLPLAECNPATECGVIMCGEIHAHAELPPWAEGEHFERVTR